MEEQESAKTTEPAEVQEQVVETTPVVETTDYEAEIAAKDAEIERLNGVVSDKDAGLKKYKDIAKGKSDWSDDTDETLTPEKYREIAREEAEKALALSGLAQANKEKDDLVKKALRDNKELRTALQNRPNTVAQGAAADNTPASTADIIPAAKLAELKAQGWTDAKLDKLRANIKNGNIATL